MNTCKHTWQLYPPNQHTEYKCVKCSALGFFENHTHKIKPRKCQRQGCIEDAVDKVDGVRLCTRHKNEE